MVNYHGSQKAVVRVNPSAPLGTLVPVICDKCDFDAAHVLLLRDSVSRRELPLDKSLSELDIKELYVHDRSLGTVEDSLFNFCNSFKIISSLCIFSNIWTTHLFYIGYKLGYFLISSWPSRAGFLPSPRFSLALLLFFLEAKYLPSSTCIYEARMDVQQTGSCNRC